MIRFVAEFAEPTDFLVATEANMLWQLQTQVPRHSYHPVPGITCAVTSARIWPETRSSSFVTASTRANPRSAGSASSIVRRLCSAAACSTELSRKREERDDLCCRDLCDQARA